MKAKKSWTKMASFVALSAMFLSAPLYADETSQNISIAKFISNLKISGDMRVRQENFYREPTKPGTDRSRQRFRFRLGITPQIEDITIGFRLASGAGEQVSTNQTFDNLSNQKPIFIDLAFLQWKAFEWMKLTGGKMSNPFWTVYSSDIVWDPDVNPEGFAEQFDYKFHERFSAFANFGQFPLKNNSSSPDAWMLGNQAGFRTKLFEETKLNLGASLYKFLHAYNSSFGQGSGTYPANQQDGNTRVGTTAVLRATFTVVHLTSELKTRVMSWPLSIQADYANNIADNGVLLSTGAEHVGYQIGAILGNASAKNTWEVAYFFKWLETNATLADLADSDFGNGGANRRGHIIWFAYAPRDYVQLKAKAFITETIRNDMPPYTDNINRLQFDVLVKF